MGMGTSFVVGGVWEFERVIALSEKIGARLYDPSICDYVTPNSLVRIRPYSSAGRL
jgi:hypothetical protein